ncbi:UNVERIFIED_CONTAM: CDP-diacylglycerol--serine O-phosphatidyltransferase 1 [Sesamum radiatum]|uniref:CDP-diacylglycerol--serine O-phosphatidyltransferase n=1 Tax=Sesamum radiatum TaxID=300843 RepID=A0AAW2V6K5_SESRA
MEVNGYRRARRKDLVTYQNGDVSTSNIEDELDPWIAWAYKPRTITLLLIGACFLVWASGALDPERSSENNLVTSVKRGVWAMSAVFLAYSLLQAPSTVLTRPHPAIWRLVHGMAVIYLVALTFLLFQNFRSDPMVLIAGFMCLKIQQAGLRMFILKQAIHRSVLFTEVILYFSGIWAGMRTVRYFDGKTYEWVGISRQPNIMGKVKRTLGQFTPARWDKDEWHPFLGPFRFIQVLSLCIVFLTVELNTFFLKFCLWIPPRNPLIIYRLVLWWLIAIPTIREYNSYLQNRKTVKKVGAFCWLSLAICIVELLICIKFGHGLFPNAMPKWLVIFWSCVWVGLVIFLGAWSWQLHRSMRIKRE